MNRKELKEQAKKSLKGKYGDYFILIIIYALLTSGLTEILYLLMQYLNIRLAVSMPILFVVELLVSSMLTLGNVSYILKVSRGEKVTWKELFTKISLWQLYFVTSLIVFVFTTLWSILLVIPGIIAMYKYAMTSYILVDNPNTKALEAITKSREMMMGYKADLFLLNLSFIGWIILGIFTLGLLYIWLIPYMNVTMANFYNNIKDKKAA